MRKELVKASDSCCTSQWESKSQNWQDRKENEGKKEREKGRRTKKTTPAMRWPWKDWSVRSLFLCSPPGWMWMWMTG